MRPSASGFGFGGAGGCAGAPLEGRGEAAQSVRSDSDRSFGFWPRTMSRGSACAGGAAQAVASLRDACFEYLRMTLRTSRAVTRFSGALSASSSDSSSESISMTSESTFEVRVGGCGEWPSWDVENWTWVGISVQRPWLSMQL